MASIPITTTQTPFDIPELLDAILVFAALKMRHLLRLRRDHPKWRIAIDNGSLELRRALYLATSADQHKSYLLEEELQAEAWDMPKKIVSSVPNLAGYKLICTAANLHPALLSMRPGTYIERDCSFMRLSHATFRHWYYRLSATVRQWKYMFISQPPPSRATIKFATKNDEKPTSMVIERKKGLRMCDLLRELQRLHEKKGGKQIEEVGYDEISVMDMAIYDNKDEAMGRIETFW